MHLELLRPKSGAARTDCPYFNGCTAITEALIQPGLPVRRHLELGLQAIVTNGKGRYLIETGIA